MITELNIPEPIINVINIILKSNPEYAHPDDSWGCCRRASVELQDALSKIGIQSTRAYSPGHTWILTDDGFNIDLTARQFGASEPCPKIWKEENKLNPINSIS